MIDFDKLPKELTEQLTLGYQVKGVVRDFTHRGNIQYRVRDIIHEFGPISKDEILVAYYEIYGEVIKRSAVVSAVRRDSEKSAVFPKLYGQYVWRSYEERA